MGESLEKIVELLDKQDIVGSKGRISFGLAGISVDIQTKDVVGGILQDWFAEWMRRNRIIAKPGKHSQSWPDFILPDGEDLEFKAFDGTASPNFDVANFDAYTRSLLLNPERLDTDHLIFEYFFRDNQIEIGRFWVKKIWEMTGPSETNGLNLQVKQGVPINIRPKNWRSLRTTFFRRRIDFVIELDRALRRFYPERHRDWFREVQIAYENKTGRYL